ncbi:uncharacterized protein FSUBG_9457 [Fusarium subglutinans]|uniref:Uncharacterized protein n=1 Tax=Gibberella subglutinans TaxID=42677 RepID=A0A8H5PCN0_GIBSU|nr:uncharacterized protein FSUBG_9457 [Fusarium subglutinans]KAF5594355.1 hypothetical protein FSUBG_9457 [Fusarium subglutinans]
MSEVVHPAITKWEALKVIVEQWTLEVNDIKSPEREYTKKRQMLLSHYNSHLSHVKQHSLDHNEYARRSEAILQYAGDLRELDIEYQNSVTLLERQFGERLEAAIQKLTCDLLPTLGDTLLDPSVATVLSQCLRPKESTIEAGDVQEEPIAVLEAHKDPGTDPDIPAEAPIDLEGGQSQGSRPIAGNSEHQNQALEQASGLTEARTSVAGDTLNQHQSAVYQTLPVQERESSSQSNPATYGQGATSPLAAQAPTPSPTTEASQLSEGAVGTHAKSSPITMPASETNLGQNGGTARWDMWQASQTQDQSVSSAEWTGNQNNTSNGQQTTDSLVVHLRAPLKRLQPEASSSKQKRQKLPVARPEVSEERVIDFDQVFQDGNAHTKYIIVEYPPEFGDWYILECKEHNKHFYKDPIRGASRHLMGQEHGVDGAHSFAVKMLGTRVLDCNEILAAKNNRVTRQWFPHVARPTSMILGNGTKEDPTRNVEIIPIVGEIYAAKFPKQSHTYAVLVLPWTAFDHFPYMKQLLRDTPSCYLFDKDIDQYPRGWAKEYEDGGRKVKERVYPVVYFHKENFPVQCDIGWVPLTSFKIYDPAHTGVVCSKIVDRYLQNKDPRLAANHEYSDNHSIIILDGDDGEEQVGLPQMENRNVDRRALYTSDSQEDGVCVSRSDVHTQDPCTTSGPTARIEYPFVSGGSEDMGSAESRTASFAATLASKQPIGSVVELGEIHAESTNSDRPDPQRFDAHSLRSPRPPPNEDIEAVSAETREALLALGPDISSHVRWCDEGFQKS